MFESKRRALIFLFASVFLALVAVILFSDYIQKTKQSLGEMATVLVAKEDIRAGTAIPDSSLAEKEIPRQYLLDSLIQSKEELKGKISVVPIPKGAALTSTMLSDNTIVTGDNRQVMLRAPLAVFDDNISTFDKVDLVVSYDDQSGAGDTSKGDKRTTKVLMRDVTVSAVGKKAGSEELAAVGVVVKLEDANSLIWALNFGKEIRVLKSGTAKAQVGNKNARQDERQQAGQTQQKPQQSGQQSEQQAEPQAQQTTAGQQAEPQAPAQPEEGAQSNGGS